tara:strand:+ start:3015 stop:3614 length:600 start_codon:yes stop_codon:yes gene_type:complete
MDILYYSNYCKHSKKLLTVLSRCKNIKESLSFISIDNRVVDQKTNQVFIVLENGNRVVKPPNLHSVPALLLVNEKYRFLYGDDIVDKLRPQIISDTEKAVNFNGEPVSYEFNNGSSFTNVMSEKFTYYNLTDEELSAKGNGGRRNMHNYVLANDDILTINTPADTYKPDKVDKGLTIDSLKNDRDQILQNREKTPQLEL